MIINLTPTYPTPGVSVAQNSSPIDFAGGAAQVASLAATAAQAFAAEAAALTQPAALAAALATLSDEQLAALAVALLQALAVQHGAGAPVPTGSPYVNDSGFVVIAQ